MFLAFLSIAACDVHALQAGLLLPPELLGKVRPRAISHAPIHALVGVLLSKSEAGQLALCPQPTYQQ
jgi:hypothetical protein